MQVGMLEAKGIGWKQLDKYTNIIDSITLKEIKKAGKVYFNKDDMLTTILRPEK